MSYWMKTVLPSTKVYFEFNVKLNKVVCYPFQEQEVNDVFTFVGASSVCVQSFLNQWIIFYRIIV